MRLFIAWFKRKLRVVSPSTHILGYKFEYDYLLAQKARKSNERRTNKPNQ